MPEQDALYKVGYAKPPKSGQFEKGSSGNPKGRPKGSKNLAKIVLQESRQRVRVKGPHGTRTVTKLEAAMMQIGNQAAQGELRAARELFSLVQRSEEVTNVGMSPLNPHEIDQQVMQFIRRRMERMNAHTSSTSPETERKES
jgi:hypothetical protein